MSLASYHCSTPGSVSEKLLKSWTLEALSTCWLARRRRCRGGGRCRLAARARMSAEHPRRRKFAQLVADHVLRHEQLDELPAVVNHERVPDKVRHDGAIARPRLERLATARTLLPLHFGQQPIAYIRTFFDRPTHLYALRRSQF